MVAKCITNELGHVVGEIEIAQRSKIHNMVWYNDWYGFMFLSVFCSYRQVFVINTLNSQVYLCAYNHDERD